MSAYEFQFLKQNSFPNNSHYEATLKDFEKIFKEQVKAREKALKAAVDAVFKDLKTASGNKDNKDFTLTKLKDETLISGGHVTKFAATLQQVFAIPVFEVSYAFSRWDLEGNISSHYKAHPSTKYDASKLFVADSVRVKNFAKGDLHEHVEHAFKKHEKEFEAFTKGFGMQTVEK